MRTTRIHLSRSGALKVIFISHSSSDIITTRKLVFELNYLGAKTWFDETEITAVSPVFGSIEQAIRNCDVVVLVASVDSLESDYVKREIKLALQLDKPLAIVRVPGSNVDISGDLADYKHFNLSDFPSFSRAAREIIKKDNLKKRGESPEEFWGVCRGVDPLLNDSVRSNIHALKSVVNQSATQEPLVRLLREDYTDLVQSFDVVHDIDVSWLPPELRRDFIDLPEKADRVSNYISSLTYDYLQNSALDSQTFESEYFRIVSTHLIVSLNVELLKLPWAQDPDGISSACRVLTNARNTLTSSSPFPTEGISADICLGEITEQGLAKYHKYVGKCHCPDYVEEKDFRFSVFPNGSPTTLTEGLGVVVPYQLGIMTGWADSWNIWRTLRERRAEARIPSPDSVLLGIS